MLTEEAGCEVEQLEVATCVVLHNMCDLHGNMWHMELEDTPDSEVMPSPSTTAETNSSRMRDAIMHYLSQ